MKGKVYLVGAGPGDPKLMTLKGLECIKKADIIVYDRLANKILLSEAKSDCEFIYVGKKSSNHTKTQSEINEIIVQEVLKGKKVTRLKGGDPYVFGRGGEEGEYLFERGIQFEVVPGITSAIGGLCYAGIPITHRDYASSFHIITGHLKDEENELDWKSLATLNGTLVFLMGMANLNSIRNSLIKNGKDKNTPTAIINWAARPNQKVLVGTLENIYEKVIEEGMESPSLIVVGDVVKLRAKLNFYENKPLFGKNIVVTRARAQSSDLTYKLNEVGANVIEFPTIKIKKILPNVELDENIRKLDEFTYIIFTSVNGVQVFFDRLFELDFDTRKLGNLKIVAIGSATAKKLRDYGLCADFVPQNYVAEDIVSTLNTELNNKDKIIIPRANEARKYLVEELSKICMVKEIKIYETVKDHSDKNQIIQLLDNKKIDTITFTSSSTVKNFIDILGKKNLSKLGDVELVSIGPITSKTIKLYGLNVYREAEEYTIDGIVYAITKDIKDVK